MKIKSANQISLEELKKTKIDAFIAASGFEARASYLANCIKCLPSHKLAFCFSDRKILSRKRNDVIYNKLGYSMINASGDDYQAIINQLNDLLHSLKPSNKIRILVDYSCMTRIWYSSILSYFCGNTIPFKNVELIFSYTPAKFAKPHISLPNRHMDPIPGFSFYSPPEKNIALVIGLGYEADRALGLMDYIDPALTFSFHAAPCFDDRFVKAVLSNNSVFFNKIPAENAYRYPFSDLKTTEVMLSSLCRSLANEYRLILAPLGPKPFTLISLLMVCKYRNADLWRVSSGVGSEPYDLKPGGTPLICNVNFIQ